ncbi:UNVERIFIED_CONTAM: putative F-box/FBD/LRR-repeat protein [Sesamum latifolium]|uniref:F-box/FBD/LRR-repeat protein n=1 Tax=Sesamum latifolium TaxID=2727402 RepID=A0AAW2XXS5_9LAMI
MVHIIEGESSSSNRHRRPVVRGADRLSTLPQHILTEILSRLSTIEAARVSFGSRIWMTTWRLLPNLVFDYSQFPDVVNKAHSFLRFVDWTVAHHDESDVKIFELQLGPTTYCEVLMKYQWVEFAIQHNVQNLVLHGRVCGTQNLADSIFSCRSLVKLELSVNELVFSWPETIQLPNLKKLKLKFLLLPEMITSQDLFSNFPALEKLSMFFCKCSCLGMESCSIRLQTPSLSKFIYTSWDPRESALQVPPCAFSLVVDGDDSCMFRGSPDELSRTAVKLTRELFGTSYITTGRWLIQYLSMVPDLPRQLASVRYNYLLMLNVNLWPVARHVKTLMLLVSKCPILSVLSIYFVTPQGRIVNRGSGVYVADYDGAGDFGDLHDVTIENFGGNWTEMMLVRYLLARTPHLYIMRIEINPLLDDVDADLKIHQILEYWRASPDANIMFN